MHLLETEITFVGIYCKVVSFQDLQNLVQMLEMFLVGVGENNQIIYVGRYEVHISKQNPCVVGMFGLRCEGQGACQQTQTDQTA